jgi:hypothetical protein
MNLVNTEYITIDQAFDSTMSDMKRYRDNGLVDMSGLYKIIALCNSKAGVRIAPIMYEVLEIENNRAVLPKDFKKIKSINILSNYRVKIADNNFYLNWTETVAAPPSCGTPSYTPIGCLNDCGKCYWTIPVRKEIKNEYYVFSHQEQLNSDSYIINREEQIIEFPFRSGRAILTYYADLDELGLIPKEPQLYFYYEYMLKDKILRDVAMNSDDDVYGKIQMNKQDLFGAFVDFDNYLKSESYKQYQERQRKQDQEFYDKWFFPILS